MRKVCEVSTYKSSVKVCENVCEKVYEKVREKYVKRMTWFHTLFHLPFTCLSHSIISHAYEKKMLCLLSSVYQGKHSLRRRQTKLPV